MPEEFKREMQLKESIYSPRETIEQVEEGDLLCPKFNNEGLIPCIITDCVSNEVLMHAYMNNESFQLTIETGEGHYWSRSRNILWKKGASSGMIHKVQEILVDDDQDSIWLKVDVRGIGASCHVGYKSCFYRSVEYLKEGKVNLKFTETEKVFDPDIVYSGSDNPTKL